MSYYMAVCERHSDSHLTRRPRAYICNTVRYMNHSGGTKEQL